MKYLVTLCISTLLLSCGSYSRKQKLGFKPHDTIYVKWAGQVCPAEVIKNDQEQEVLILNRKNIFDNNWSHQNIEYWPYPKVDYTLD